MNRSSGPPPFLDVNEQNPSHSSEVYHMRKNLLAELPKKLCSPTPTPNSCEVCIVILFAADAAA